MSSGKFYPHSKTWADVPHGGPELELWRGFHQPHGAPHPPSWEVDALVYEVMPPTYKRFFDRVHVFVWSCEDPIHHGPVVFVIFPWCSRCLLRSRTRTG